MNATYYVQAVDGWLRVTTTGFIEGAKPLAVIVTLGGQVVSVTDKRQ